MFETVDVTKGSYYIESVYLIHGRITFIFRFQIYIRNLSVLNVTYHLALVPQLAITSPSYLIALFVIYHLTSSGRAEQAIPHRPESLAIESSIDTASIKPINPWAKAMCAWLGLELYWSCVHKSL